MEKLIDNVFIIFLEPNARRTALFLPFNTDFRKGLSVTEL
jgi:hypothetical protein